MLLLSFYLINFFFHENYFYFIMFRDVPGCSGMFGMFRHVPGCSVFRVLSTPTGITSCTQKLVDNARTEIETNRILHIKHTTNLKRRKS